jgi:beta-glucosidase/6-phospho-beta-glucosidase/beta-galactosidase
VQPGAVKNLDSDVTRSFHPRWKSPIVGPRDGGRRSGYHCWSLMDNFEWPEGYSQKFGLAHVDFRSPARKRTLKESGRWYARVASQNRVV